MFKIRPFLGAILLCVFSLSAMQQEVVQPVSFSSKCKSMFSSAAGWLWRGACSVTKQGASAAWRHTCSASHAVCQVAGDQIAQHPRECGLAGAAVLGAYLGGRVLYSCWCDRFKIYPQGSGRYSLRQVNQLLFPEGGERRTKIYQWNKLWHQGQWPQAYTNNTPAGTAVGDARDDNRLALPADMKTALYPELAAFCAQSQGMLAGQQPVTLAAAKTAMRTKITQEVQELERMLGSIRPLAEFRVGCGQQLDWRFAGYGAQYKNVCNQHGGIANIAEADHAGQRVMENEMRAAGPSWTTRIFGWCNILNPFVKSKLFMKTASDLCWEIQRRIALLNALSLAMAPAQGDDTRQVNIQLAVVQ